MGAWRERVAARTRGRSTWLYRLVDLFEALPEVVHLRRVTGGRVYHVGIQVDGGRWRMACGREHLSWVMPWTRVPQDGPPVCARCLYRFAALIDGLEEQRTER